MKKIVLLMCIMMSLGACAGASEPAAPLGTLSPVTARDLQVVTGQMLYVPAYSQIFHGTTRDSLDLAVTLTVHNTDLENAIILQSVRYYDTDGMLVREYVDAPMEVSSLATIGFFVPENDLSGGWGANFIVEWVAETPVHEPVVEAVMVSTRSTLGVSMISEGRILSQTVPEDSATSNE